MHKYLYLLLYIFFANAFSAKAQDSLISNNKEQLKQALNMNQKDYLSYSDQLKKYHSKLLLILHDQSLNNDQRREAIGKLELERISFINTHLTVDQKERLKEFRKKNPPPVSSARDKRKKELKDRLNKKR
jgi:hypothetical protein